MNKFKKDFNLWFYREYSSSPLWDMWQANEVPLQMQWGVYVDFFEKNKLSLDVGLHTVHINEKPDIAYAIYSISHVEKELAFGRHFTNHDEARKEALKKATQIYNEKSFTNNS